MSGECYRRVTGLEVIARSRSVCLGLRAVEGNVPIRSRVGLSKVGAWTLRACLYACGGLAAAFMLGMILTVIFARPASAAQNLVAPVSGTALPGVAGSGGTSQASAPVQAAGGAMSSV